MQKIFFVFGFFIFSLSVSAQVKSCNLQLNVFDGSKKEKIEGAELRLVNFDTFKVLKAKTENGTKIFDKLKNGRYRIEVEKEEFKTSFKRIYLNCDKETVTEEIFLSNGTPSEKVFLLEDDSRLTPDNEYIFEKDLNLVGFSMPRPAYVGKCASDCEVKVSVLIDETGKVISVQAISGQQFLHESTEKAAKNSKFLPVFYKGKSIRIRGTMTYQFK